MTLFHPIIFLVFVVLYAIAMIAHQMKSRKPSWYEHWILFVMLIVEYLQSYAHYS